jgi:hypothetical protein
MWEGAKKADRDPTELDVVSTIYTDVDEHYERAYQHVAPVTKGLLVLEGSMIKLLGREVEIPQELSFNRILVNDGEGDGPFPSADRDGSPAHRRGDSRHGEYGPLHDIRAAIERFLDARSTSIVICNFVPDPVRTYRAYSETIMPYLREQYAGDHKGRAPDAP